MQLKCFKNNFDILLENILPYFQQVETCFGHSWYFLVGFHLVSILSQTQGGGRGAIAGNKLFRASFSTELNFLSRSCSHTVGKVGGSDTHWMPPPLFLRYALFVVLENPNTSPSQHPCMWGDLSRHGRSLKTLSFYGKSNKNLYQSNILPQFCGTPSSPPKN